MKHIKTPIKPGGSGQETTAIYDAQGRLIAANPFRHAGSELCDIVIAVNAHDDLIAQRDALVEACKDAHDSISTLPINVFGTGVDGQLEWPIRDEVLHKIAAALALVRGKVEPDA